MPEDYFLNNLLLIFLSIFRQQKKEHLIKYEMTNKYLDKSFKIILIKKLKKNIKICLYWKDLKMNWSY